MIYLKIFSVPAYPVLRDEGAAAEVRGFAGDQPVPHPELQRGLVGERALRGLLAVHDADTLLLQ